MYSEGLAAVYCPNRWGSIKKGYPPCVDFNLHREDTPLWNLNEQQAKLQIEAEKMPGHIGAFSFPANEGPFGIPALPVPKLVLR
jgi:hypothetical protein